VAAEAGRAAPKRTPDQVLPLITLHVKEIKKIASPRGPKGCPSLVKLFVNEGQDIPDLPQTLEERKKILLLHGLSLYFSQTGTPPRGKGPRSPVDVSNRDPLFHGDEFRLKRVGRGKGRAIAWATSKTFL